jgi:hypothetical protein
MYALVLEAEGYEFLIDPRDLWKPPRVLVRRGRATAEVWLDEDYTEITWARSLSQPEQEHILALTKDNIDDLLTSWCSLKDDVRRERLERNLLVD